MENNSIEDLSQKQSDENIPDIEPTFIPTGDDFPEEADITNLQQEEYEKGWEKYRDKHPPLEFERIFEPAMVQPYDNIKKPSHYKFFGEDSMAMIEKILGTEGYLGFLKGNALKYRVRAGKKDNTIADIDKALYYEELYNKFVKENTP